MLYYYHVKYRFSNSLRIMICLLIFLASIANCLGGAYYAHFALMPVLPKTAEYLSMHSTRHAVQSMFVKKQSSLACLSLPSHASWPGIEPGIWPIASVNETASILPEYNFLPRLMHLSPDRTIDLRHSPITEKDLDGDGIILLFGDSDLAPGGDDLDRISYIIPLSPVSIGLQSPQLRTLSAYELPKFQTMIAPRNEQRILQFIQDRRFCSSIIFIQFEHKDHPDLTLPGVIVVDRDKLQAFPSGGKAQPILAMESNPAIIGDKEPDEASCQMPATLADVSSPPPTVDVCKPELIRRASIFAMK